MAKGTAIYLSMLDKLSDAVFVLDDKSYVLEANKTAVSLFGLDPICEKALLITQLIRFGNDDFNPESFISATDTKGWGIFKNGDTFPVNINATPIAAGDDGKYLFVVKDISLMRQKDHQLSMLLHHTRDAFLLLDTDLRILSFNDAFFETCKQSMGFEVQTGTAITSYGSAETLKETLEKYERILSGNPLKIEMMIPQKDGTPMPFEIEYIPSRDDEGIVTGVFTTAKNITHSRELQDLLHTVNTMAGIGGWEYDIRTGSNYWSPVTRDLYEVSPDFIPDINTGINFYKDDYTRKLVKEYLRRAISEGKSWDAELAIITAKGNEKWLRVLCDVEMVDGKAVRVYGSFQDITERKKAAQNVEQAFHEKMMILESIDDAFFAVDRNWVVTYWNHKAESVLRKSRLEMIGKPLWDVFSGSVGSYSYNKYRQALFTQEVVRFEDWYEMLNRWYEIAAFPSTDGLSVYLKDITERKATEIAMTELNAELKRQTKELSRSNSELEQFAYIASHDLQEPLRMVTSFVTQLEKKYTPILDQKGKVYIDFAVEGTRRMRQIILDLLEFSRVGRMEENAEEIGLNQLVNEIISMFPQNEEEVPEPEYIIHELPVITGPRGPIRQVFQNLLSNAIKYVDKGVRPRIEVLVSDHGEHYEFSLTDNGIGIEKEFWEKIFIIFQRLHRREEYSGTGMGLAVTKKIVENMGGHIWLRSMPGKGSTFYFTLMKHS